LEHPWHLAVIELPQNEHGLPFSAMPMKKNCFPQTHTTPSTSKGLRI
jgi:hypothetical protein